MAQLCCHCTLTVSVAAGFELRLTAFPLCLKGLMGSIDAKLQTKRYFHQEEEGIQIPLKHYHNPQAT